MRSGLLRPESDRRWEREVRLIKSAPKARVGKVLMR